MSLDEKLAFLTHPAEKLKVAMPDGELPDKGERGAYKGTISNLKALFDYYGITCQYDNISKAQSLTFHTKGDTHDLTESSNYAVLSSLLSLNNMPQSAINLLPALMVENTVNPVLDFIEKLPYKRDEIDYFRIVADSLIVDEYDKPYRDLALRTWLYQCVAAADSAKRAMCGGLAKFELVFVLQGEQGIGKTTWFKSLVPKLLQAYVATGEHLDPDDTNSLRRCLATWICEIGELDATFRKSDIERLKAFLSQFEDKIRLPYDRGISNYRRRTSFCGSVNPKQFLVDRTGNRRFLPLAVKQISRLPDNPEFLQRFWSQIWHEYTHNFKAIWWASEELEKMLQEKHETHTETSPIEELIAEVFDLEQLDNSFAKHYTVTKILSAVGINNPNKYQTKETRAFLEKMRFIEKKINGSKGFWLVRKATEHYE